IGERLCLQRGRLAPRAPALRTSHSRTSTQPTARRPGPASSTSHATEELAQNGLTTKRSSLCVARREGKAVSNSAQMWKFCPRLTVGPHLSGAIEGPSLHGRIGMRLLAYSLVLGRTHSGNSASL